MPMPCKGLGGRKLVMSAEIQLIVSNLAGKVRALAHPACNCHACTETWLFAHVLLLIPLAKFNILGHSNKMRKHLYYMRCLVLFNILETGLHNQHEIFWFVLLLTE